MGRHESGGPIQGAKNLARTLPRPWGSAPPCSPLPLPKQNKMNLFSKKKEEPKSQKIKITIYFKDDTNISLERAINSMAEFTEKQAEYISIVSQIHDEIKKHSELILAWNGAVLFRAEDFRRAVISGSTNFGETK